MARNISKQEINLIDDRLLLDGIYGSSQGSEVDLPDRADANLVELAPQTRCLGLSYKDVGKIENIVGFTNLTKLCLDNNKIREIVNLENLVNLRWLDLSFNKLHKIQGLSSLTKLEDLSLYNNKITIVEGLDTCTALQCLSLGNNRIQSLEQLLRLRQLRSLRMLTLAGNPVCKEAEFRMTVLAYVDSLKYLDYALVDPSEFNTAQEQYHDELMDVKEKESVMSEKLSRDRQMSEYIRQLEEAGNVFAHVLFDDMFAEDSDLERLKHLPGIRDLVENFRVTYKAMSEEFIRAAMERHEKKRQELTYFEKSIGKIRGAADADSIALVETFNKRKKDALVDIHDRPDKARIVNTLLAELDSLFDELMGIEMRSVEKFDILVDAYDNTTNDLKNNSLDMQQSFFRAIEELEDKFSNSMRAVATDLMDRQTREELAEDFLDDEAMGLVVDKETCLQALSGSHDMHVGRILKREDEARAGEMRRYQESLTKFTNAERLRNRDRVLQVHELVKGVKHSLTAILSVEEEDVFDEDAF